MRAKTKLLGLCFCAFFMICVFCVIPSCLYIAFSHFSPFLFLLLLHALIPYSTQFEFYGYIGADAYSVKSLLERKGIEGIGDEYFSLKPKGVELAGRILENHLCI